MSSILRRGLLMDNPDDAPAPRDAAHAAPDAGPIAAGGASPTAAEEAPRVATGSDISPVATEAERTPADPDLPPPADGPDPPPAVGRDSTAPARERRLAWSLGPHRRRIALIALAALATCGVLVAAALGALGYVRARQLDDANAATGRALAALT